MVALTHPAFEDAPATADELVRTHVGLLDRVLAQVAARFPVHVDRDELRSAGALGLVEAARRYEPALGVPFDRYAAIRIRGAMLDSTRSRDWATRSIRRQARELNDAEEHLAARNGGVADGSAVADLVGATQEEIDRRRARAAEAVLLSLDYETDGETAAPHEFLVEESREAAPEAALVDREVVGTLREAVAALPETHREVVCRYYFGGELLAEIASDFGVTVARISQINAEALVALRGYFGLLYEGVPAVEDQAPGRRVRDAYLCDLAGRSTWRSRLDAADWDSAAAPGPTIVLEGDRVVVDLRGLD